MKERIRELDFIRAVCTLGIIINHFTISIENSHLQRLFYTYPSGCGSVGYTLVTVFFILSGGGLYYNYNSIHSIKTFYSKRWKSIFPSYYIAYIFAICGYALFRKSFFEGKKLYQLIYTVIGMDGYISKQVDTWYTIGEWFIGAILICYIAYPYLLHFIKTSEAAVVAVSMSFFLIFLDWRMLNQNSFRNIFSCLVSFILGMMFVKYKLYSDKHLRYVSGVLIIIFILFPLNINENLLSHAVGVLLFFSLFEVGVSTMKTRVSGFIYRISAMSYEMFLIHHVIILTVVRIYKPANIVSSVILFIVVVLITYLGARFIKGVKNINHLLHSQKSI